MDRQKVNGWTNHATFLVALNIDNTQGEQEHWAEQARLCRAETASVEYAQYMLAEMLREEHDDHIETYNLISFAADLMQAALSEVNWREVAEHLLSD